MSKNTHLSRLNVYLQRKIAYLLAQNGCDDETINLFLSSGKLADIDEYMDMEEVFA